jgi:hypothetical protein
VDADDVNTVADLVLAGTLCSVWLAAGMLADALPAAQSALELRRRAGVLSTVLAGGALVFVAIPLVSYLAPGSSAAPTAALLAAVPGLFAVTVSLRRLTRVRRGAEVFATAPQTPVPPALRAAAAHPLLTTPPQVTGLAAIIGLPIAAHLITAPGAEVAGIAIALVGVSVLVVAVRAGVRHSRLSLLALAPIRIERRRAPTRPS